MSPRLLVGLLCLVNLVAGVGLGVALDRTVLVERPHKHGRGDRPDFARMLEKRLDLDAEQAKKVREILATRRPLFEEAMHDVRPKLDAIRAESDAQIRAVLRPDQAARWDELRKDMQRHERERGSAPVDSESRTGKEGRN